MENKNIELELGRRVSKEGRLMNENLKLDEALCKSFDFWVGAGKPDYLIKQSFFVEFCEFMLYTSFFLSFPPNPKTNYERKEVFSIKFAILSPK